MTVQVERKPEGKRNVFHIFLLTLALLVPGLLWMIFGWASSLLPLLVFIFIKKYGWSHTNSHLTIAMLAATAGGYFFQGLEMTLFSISMLPTGYIIAYSSQKGDAPWYAGLQGTAVLAVSFTIFFSLITVNSNISFFQAITASLNTGIDEALRLYRANDTMSAENFVILEQTLNQMKVVVPIILPAVLGSLLVLTNWITVVLGNTLLPKLGCQAPWQSYSLWRLPDKLIWLLIASAVFAVIPSETTQALGINCLILTVLPYCFQGLAVTVCMLNRWNVPRYLRALIYIMVALQSFGTILLIVIGIADVWFDIRKITTDRTKNTTKN